AAELVSISQTSEPFGRNLLGGRATSAGRVEMRSRGREHPRDARNLHGGCAAGSSTCRTCSGLQSRQGLRVIREDKEPLAFALEPKLIVNPRIDGVYAGSGKARLHELPTLPYPVFEIESFERRPGQGDDRRQNGHDDEQFEKGVTARRPDTDRR